MGLRSLALVVLGFVVGAAVILFAEGSDNGSAATSTPAAVAAAAATASDGHNHTHGASGLTGDTPCEQAGIADPEGTGQGSGHGHRGPSEWTAVDPATRDVLEQQLAVAHTVATQFPTVASAEAAGYRMTTGYIPCIGAHYINPRYLFGDFDPAHPAMLLYDGTTEDASIVGLSYAKGSGKEPPEGFAGPNDPWHQHNLNGGLCIKGGVVVGGESTSVADCKARGGSKAGLNDLWMMHAWVADAWPSSWGVFSAEHPDLGGARGNINAQPATTAAATKG